MSCHWDRLWGRLQDGVLGDQEAEARRRLWRGPLAPKQLLFPSTIECYVHSNQGLKSHPGIPESEKSRC